MSYITDRLRAESARLRGAQEVTHVPGQMFEDILRDAQVQRRSLLKGGLGATIAAAFGTLSLAGCGGSDDESGPDYGVKFKQVAEGTGETVVVPEGYSYDVMFAAGDAVTAGGIAFNGVTFQNSTGTEKFAGGQHDGMEFFALPNVDPNKGGLLAINHEAPDARILFAGGAIPGSPTTEDRKIALSSVGVTVVEVELASTGKWRVKANSPYNKRYTGNTTFDVRGPAAGTANLGTTVVGTLNNCSSGATPWGTYLTCEETTDNYLDPTNAEEGYGWVVEIDPQNSLFTTAIKRTALGRFDHENSAYMVDAQNNVAFYLGDDGTPGCIYKFVPSAKYNPNDRAANRHLLDAGTLYVAKFNAGGTGQWLALVQGQNGLTTTATDPGNTSQGTTTPTPVSFATQADVLINTKAAARVAGGTLMDRPEWITVGPDKKIYVTLTNNGSRQVVDAANPRQNNSHGHIVKWTEAGDSPTATSFNWEIFLLAGDPSLATDNLKGNINGDTFSSPDGIRVDPKGRLWVQTDAGTGSSITNVFGNNSMYYLDQTTKKSTRFLVGPNGCEITGIAYTPDLATFFINIQHPTGTWPTNVRGENNNALPPRSATIVVRRNDGQPVGA
jgi:secreted PhoX family phosphatase